MPEVPAENTETSVDNSAPPKTKNAPPAGAATANAPKQLSFWATLIAPIKGLWTWIGSHRREALGTSALMLALALIVVGGLIGTDQGRDLLQSANDWYRGFFLFSGLTASLVILEGLILLLVKKENEEFDIELLVNVSLISALVMAVITWFHNNVLVAIAVAVVGWVIGVLIPLVFTALLNVSKKLAARFIGLIACLILFLSAVWPNAVGDSIGSALALTLVIVGWLFVIFALATTGYISGNSGRGTKFIIRTAAIVWAVKSVVMLGAIWIRGYPSLDYVRYDADAKPPQLRTLTEAYTNWRDEAGRPDDKPTLILVGAAGGGIRASFWTSLIMARLADNVPQFKQKLFASSGVSGGSLGLGVSYSLLAKGAHCAKDSKQVSCVQAFHDGDFLSGVIGATIAGLPARTLMPLWFFSGRDGALETSWENRWNWAVGSEIAARDAFSKPIGALWNNVKAHPLLLLNATTATTGDRAVTADVAIDWVKLRTQCKINLTQEINPPLSASIGASARFPFVSDWGWVRVTHADACKQLEAVADGGFYDNYGATTLIDLINGLKAIDAAFFSKVHVVVIQITSDPLRDMGCLFKNLDEDKTDPAHNFCQPQPPQPTYWSKIIDGAARLFNLSPSEKPDTVKPSAGLRQFFSNASSILQNATFGGGGPGVVDVALQARAATGIDVAQNLRKITCEELHGSYYHLGMTGAQDIPLGWAISQASQDRLTKLITDPTDYRTKRLNRLINELLTNKAQSQC